jgi:cytochrome c oxidase assembly factor CtaG
MADYLPLALVWAALGLHLLGERRAAILTGRPRDRRARKRAVMFYAGLATIFVALATPIDTLSEELLWVHMIQHMLLLTVAAPLIVLGAPWRSLWRPLPLGFRRKVARAVYRSPGLAPLRAMARAVATPLGAWLMFTAGLYIWHLPGAYDLALTNTYVHALEHITFIVCAILFWAQVTASPPATSTLSPLGRIAYAAAGSAANVVLAAILAFSTTALYPHYVHLAHRPGGISVLADQQFAAGVMWSAGDVPFGIAIAWLVHAWLSEQERRTRELDELATVPADDPSVDGEPAPETALESRLGEATKTARRPAGWLGS